MLFSNVLMNQNYFQFNNNKLYEDVRYLPVIHGERTSPQLHNKAQNMTTRPISGLYPSN